MLQLIYHNDGKEKWQSFEVYCKEADFYLADKDIYSRNPFDIMGYGATKDEALKNFIRKWIA